MKQLDPSQLDETGLKLRRLRIGGLLIGSACSAVSLWEWLGVPLQRSRYPPSNYAAAWISLFLACAAIAAVVVGVSATLRASRFSAGIETRSRLRAAFFPMLLTALAVVAQFDLWK